MRDEFGFQMYPLGAFEPRFKGQMRLYGKSDAPAPDPLIGQAAQMSADTANRALEWYMQQYEDSAPAREAANSAALEASQLQAEQMRLQNKASTSAQDFYDTTFKPLEQKIVADAQAYDTPERREAEAGRAMASVGTQFAQQRDQMQRQASALGVGDPSSGASVARAGTLGAMEAASRAAAGNSAIQNVETVGRAMKADAANLGRNIASGQATQAGLALSAGTQSAQTAGMPVTQGNQSAATYGTGFGTAINGYGQAGSIMNQQYGTQVKASDDSGIWGALGKLGGAAIERWSDVNQKENIEPMDDDEALEAVSQTPVSKWNYKPGTPGAEEEGTEQQVGPMAQDVAKNMGKGVAPGGKKLNLIAMNGVLMGAVKALDRKVDQLAASLGTQMETAEA